MIEVLSKPADQMGIGDIKDLISSKVPEGEQIEFKASLSAKGEVSDPWMAGKDKIGDRARNTILKETVAFANAHGGALLLGIKESSTKPPVATGLSPIPRCADLAERLKLVFRDCVESQLPVLEVFSVPTEGDDGVDGVIVIRVGRSRLAPHRVTTTRICPIRRSDRCEEMTMREIQDMTLNVSRGLEHLELRFAERAKRFQQEFQRLETPDDAWGIRLTAIPVRDDFRIDRVFNQGEIVKEFDEPWHRILFHQNDAKRPSDGLDTDWFPGYWQPRLRATRAESEYNFSQTPLPCNCFREFHCDGLIELGFVSVRIYHRQKNNFPCPMSPDLPIEMFANLAVWADRIRKQVNAPVAEYALEIEIFAMSDTVGVYDSTKHPIPPDNPSKLPLGSTILPRYPLGDSSSILDLLTLFDRDFWNSLGRDVRVGEGTFTIENWPD